MLKIILCDDNEHFLTVFKKYVKAECTRILQDTEEFEVGPIFSSGKDALGYLSGNQADVIFLDIDMPEINGFKVAKVLCERYKNIKIVFVSAYDNFVYNSFEFYPFAFLRKTHVSDELPRVLERIIEIKENKDNKLMLNTSLGIKSVDISSILFAESVKNYYKLHLLNGEELVCRGTLSDLEKILKKNDFFRIHSAFLINFERIERLIENNFIIISETKLPIAQRRMRDFKKAYMEYLRRCFGT